MLKSVLVPACLSARIASGFTYTSSLSLGISTIRLQVARNQAEQSLKESQHRLGLALRTGRSGAWDWDLLTEKAWWSPEMYELWAVKSGTEMNTENSMVFIDSRDRSHVKDYIKKCIAEGKDLQFEFRISHPDLGERWMEAFGHTIYDDSGRAARIIGIMLDITERKKMEEEIARSNKDLEQFAYVASHDLQEPLRAVAGFVSLIQRQLQKSINEKTKEYMKFTVDAVHRMQALIDGLLEYSRIDTRG
ncbi:MAG: PAS domain-containing protein, partial [Sedimentisphaerales bacterium]